MKDIFPEFDFSLLRLELSFKEDSVREDLIMPMLKELGYSSTGANRIIRSKAVSHPFVKTGSGKHQLTSIPDYLFEVAGNYAWVLDAKAPNEDIKTGKNVEQAYFYAIHPEVRVEHYWRFATAKSLFFFTSANPKPFFISRFPKSKNIGTI